VWSTASFYFSLRILSTSYAEDVPTFRRTLVIYRVSGSASKQDATTLTNTELRIRQEPQKLKDRFVTTAELKRRAISMHCFWIFRPLKMRGMNCLETSIFRLLDDAGDAASYPRRKNSSATPLRKPPTSQPTCNLRKEYAQGKIFITRKISGKGSTPFSYLLAKQKT